MIKAATDSRPWSKTKFALAVLLVLFACASLAFFSGKSRFKETPDFVIREPDQNDALAVYLDQSVLKKHDVKTKDFEIYFRGSLDAVGEAVASVVADMFTDGDSETAASPQPTPKNQTKPTEAYQELLDTMVAEVWKFDADGNHRTTQRYNMSDQPNNKVRLQSRAAE